MLRGFFSHSQPQDQTTPKASDQRNPFDFLAAVTPSRKNSHTSSSTPSSSSSLQPPAPSSSSIPSTGTSTPTLRPSASYSGSFSAAQGGGFFGQQQQGAGSTEPSTPGAVTPGGVRSQPTTGQSVDPFYFPLISFSRAAGSRSPLPPTAPAARRAEAARSGEPSPLFFQPLCLLSPLRASADALRRPSSLSYLSVTLSRVAHLTPPCSPLYHPPRRSRHPHIAIMPDVSAAVNMPSRRSRRTAFTDSPSPPMPHSASSTSSNSTLTASTSSTTPTTSPSFSSSSFPSSLRSRTSPPPLLPLCTAASPTPATTAISRHEPDFSLPAAPPALSRRQTAGPSAPRGKLLVKLIAARHLCAPSPASRPYVVVTFDQNEFVSREPVPAGEGAEEAVGVAMPRPPKLVKMVEEEGPTPEALKPTLLPATPGGGLNPGEKGRDEMPAVLVDPGEPASAEVQVAGSASGGSGSSAAMSKSPSSSGIGRSLAADRTANGNGNGNGINLDSMDADQQTPQKPPRPTLSPVNTSVWSPSDDPTTPTGAVSEPQGGILGAQWGAADHEMAYNPTWKHEVVL
ncbi:hypothetical protein JCM11251_005838 [Rhodosporidiobolus azoricus]